MESGATLALIAVALAYAFDFANGFHDTANAVATIIYTNAMKSRNAIIMSGLLNFLGAVVVGTAVAMIITEVVPANVITMKLVRTRSPDRRARVEPWDLVLRAPRI